MPKRLVESLASNIATTNTPSKIRIGLISPGWGSSGYYSESVVKNAATDRVWPAGTQCFLDHPGEAERYDRPERSVRDIAAVLTEDARWDDEFGGLVAEASVVDAYKDLVTDPVWAEAVGMSIRAFGESTVGEVDGQQCQIITRLTHGESVDFVTRAGRGGKVLALLESARHQISEANASEIRSALNDLVKTLHGGENTYTWVRDFDPEAQTVTFEIEAEDAPTVCYQQSYTVNDGVYALASGPVPGRMVTVFTPTQQPAQVAPQPPVAPAGPSTTLTESKEDTMPQISEADLANLNEAAGRVRRLEEAIATQTKRAEAAEKKLLTATVDRIIAESSATLTKLEHAGLMADLPVTEAGDLDEAALTKTLAEAAAEKQAANGAGSVHGFGTPVTEATAYTTADLDKVLGINHKED